MNIEAWYARNFESKIKGRYITLEHINPLLEFYKKHFEVSVFGVSELGKEIPILKVGNGKKKILAWSQMHGNESTTTNAVFDFLKFISQKDDFKDEIRGFYNNYSLYIIPILNPDGAALYTRNNANNVDINRDAQDLSQSESGILMKAFKYIKPDLCLNLHGQRTIFGLDTEKPATISFLSPSSNVNRDVTESRKVAMELIVRMNNYLQKLLPGQIGRYDDSFNANCFGDAIQMNKIPVILFEAGHIGDDYGRDQTRAYVFYSLVSLFGMVKQDKKLIDYKDYFLIPENQKNYNDYILRNVIVNNDKKPTSIAIQFTELLENGSLKFVPQIVEIGDLKDKFGHSEKKGFGEEILVLSLIHI